MRTLLMTGAAFGCLMAVGVGYSAPAYAASEDLQFIENGDTLTVQFGGDPSASISVTGSPDNWTVSLVGSGHSLAGGQATSTAWTARNRTRGSSSDCRRSTWRTRPPIGSSSGRRTRTRTGDSPSGATNDP